MAKFITSFVDNLAEQVDNLAEKVDNLALSRKFSDYGIVRDAFIPNKRGKNSGRRFGFVRFKCPVSAEVGIDKANDICLLDKTIVVKLAAFIKN